jgi:murein DD-endopeptidase MepM/ murein hydrolase activator NlpD
MSKLSVHFTFPGDATGVGDFLRIPAEAGNPVNIVYQLGRSLNIDRDKYSPTTKLVYRKQSDTWPRVPQDLFKGNAIESCNNWMLNLREGGKNLIDIWQLNPADYYDPLNEPVPQLPSEAIWLNTWMVRALEIANSYNLKLVLFSFSVGRPEYDLWQYLYPALRLGKTSGALLSLHQYGVEHLLIERNADGSLTENTLHCSLRHRKIYDALPADCKIPIIISESGAGSGYSNNGNEFLTDAIEYDKEIMKDTWVVGTNLFQLGGMESNLKPILPNLTQYIATTPTTTPPPVTPPPTSLPYVVTAYLAPQNATLEMLKFVQGEAYQTKSTVCQSADDARYLVRAGQSGSKVIIYDPETWPGGTTGIIEFFNGCTYELRYTQSTVIQFRSPIRDIPFRITSHFNDPRTYANGKHEGLDLDCWDDANSKAVKIYAAQAGTVESVNLDASHAYGRYVIINHGGTVYKTWYCHLDSVAVAVDKTVDAETVVGIGGKTGTSAIHLHFMVQKIPGGLSGYYTPDVVDPEPLTIPNIVPTLPVTYGVGMGNRAVLTTRELDALKVSKVTGFLALTMPSVEESKKIVDQIRSVNTNIFITGRLFFSADTQNKTLFNPQDFVAYCKNGLDGLYAQGVRYFQIHNEPNLEQEGMGWNWKNGAEFGTWLSGVLNIVRPLYPEAKWGYPGLSPQPNTEQFWADSKAAMEQCDWVGVHAYWQYRGTTGWGMESLDGGYHWKRLATSKPLILTEFSNNSGTIVSSVKGKEYYDYYRLINIPAFSFALSWDGDPHREGWVYNNSLTAIPEQVGAT